MLDNFQTVDVLFVILNFRRKALSCFFAGFSCVEVAELQRAYTREAAPRVLKAIGRACFFRKSMVIIIKDYIMTKKLLYEEVCIVDDLLKCGFYKMTPYFICRFLLFFFLEYFTCN